MSEQPDNYSTNWSSPRKFLFLLIVLYTVLYIFPFPFDALPHSGFIFNHYESLIDRLINFVGKHVLHITGFRKELFSDSGDTAFDYVKIFTYFILAILTSILLFIVTNKKINYEKVNYWFFIFLRYTIGFYMLVYGFDKVFKSHFPFPNLEKIEQTFGESSPQGLLWAFMGYSTTYSTFLGIIEVVSGGLLLFRKTTAFGGLLVLMIMVNVVLINFSYDVPVKLFAMHIVFFTFLIICPNLKSIVHFFFLNKEAKLSGQVPPPVPKLISGYKKIIKTVIISGFSIVFMNFSITNMRTDGDNAPKPALYGIYKTEVFKLNTDTILPLATNSTRWKEIIFDTKNTVIKSMTNSIMYYDTKADSIGKIISFTSNLDPRQKFQMNYKEGNNYLILDGKQKNNLFYIKLKKVDISKCPLINRKFQWVVEYPFNN